MEEGDFAARQETIAKESAQRMFNKMKKMREVLGNKTYNGLPVKEEDLMARYIQIRHDKDNMKQLLSANMKQSKNGQILLPKELINSMVNFETRLRKGGIL